MADLPCSKKQLGRLGDRMLVGPLNEADLDLFSRAMEAYDRRRSALQDALSGINWPAVFHRSINLEVSGRTKSLDTLVDKLRRSPGMKLASIRDIAGVRIVGPMSLHDQDGVAKGVSQGLEGIGGFHSIVDRRLQPVSGYRAVHVIGYVEGLPVEVQIRTVMQSMWADLYERFADRFGRHLRYVDAVDLVAFADAFEDPMSPEAMVARTAAALQQISVQTVAQLDQLVPLLEQASADLSVDLEGYEAPLSIAQLRETWFPARDQLTQTLRSVLTILNAAEEPSAAAEGV